LGEVWLWARPEAWAAEPAPGSPPASAAGRPFVLAVSGAFDSVGRFNRLPALLPEADVALSHLPGNLGAPELRESSVAAFCEAYGAALDAIARPAVLLGASIGGVVALGVRSRFVQGVVALDPPLRTSGLWPLIPNVQAMLAQTGGKEPWRVRFAAGVLGITTQSAPGLDHGWVLDGVRGSVVALVGGEPLEPPRRVSRLPSLVSQSDRAALAGAGIDVREVPGAGHDLAGDAGAQVLQTVRAACRGETAAVQN
jgi:pimeloyl-ACP methyl ester carboxylesterase